MSTPGDIISTPGFSYKFNCFANDLPHIYCDTHWGTEHPQRTHDIPSVLMISSGVLHISSVLHRHYAG